MSLGDRKTHRQIIKSIKYVDEIIEIEAILLSASANPKPCILHPHLTRLTKNFVQRQIKSLTRPEYNCDSIKMLR